MRRFMSGKFRGLLTRSHRGEGLIRVLAGNDSSRLRRAIPAALGLAVSAATPLWIGAAPITWIGGNTTWTDGTGASNWTPADEPDADDEAIFNQPNSVTLGSNNSIAALTMSNGPDLFLNGFSLTVNGLVSLSDAGTNLNVGGTGAVLAADEISINAGAGLNLSGGTVSIVEETGSGSIDINTGGVMSGFGTIQFNDALSAVTTVMVNDGTLSASRTSLIIGGAPPAGTLAINAADADARINLDGVSENGAVNVFRNQTLDINITLLDAFSGDINLFHNSVLDIANAWSIDSATIDVDNGFVAGNPPLIPSIPADVAYIRGGAFTQNGGTITIVDGDGALQFDASFTMNGGTLLNNGKVIFNANATIAAGANFTMPTSTSSLTVEPGVTVTVNQADFNPDGSGFSTNVITIDSAASLLLNLGAGADDVLSGVVNLNGGTLNVTDSSDSAWSINGAVNTGTNTGTSVIGGNVVLMSSADLNVGFNSTLDINAPGTWTASTSLLINTGAVARIDGSSTFSGATSITGTGTLRTGGNLTINSATTINMPNGAVDLDGTDSFGNTVTLNATSLTINAGTMNSFGGTVLGSDTLVLNDSALGLANLTVNLTDPNAEWTLVAGSGGTIIISNGGVLNINALGGNLGGGGIQGSDFNMNGTTNITGNSIWTARTDIAGTVNVAAASSFNLRGGTIADPNRLVGGTISGAGTVRQLIDTALVGFGTVATAVEFANNTQLLADDGILNVTGAIIDVGQIGTADTDGILNVVNAWNTNLANLVELKGGEIRGATITNDLVAGINGFGLVSARVINNSRIEAEGGGTLILQTPANDNDFDGTTETGTLAANTGNLEIRDTVAFAFNGRVLVGGGREVFVNGFELQMEPPSILIINNGGRFRGTTSTDFLGTTNLPGGTGTIQITANATFGAASTNTLTGTLRLANDLTVIPVGASFTGGGALRNNSGSTLRLNDGVTSANLSVLVQNDGTLQLATDTAAGQVQLIDFQQTASGAANMQLGGTGLNDFDRISVLGTAAIDGHLQLGLIGGYNPAYLVPHEIIAALSVAGTFDTIGGLIVNADKYLAVTYDPNSVLVTAAIPGDANLDGQVNILDLDRLAQNWQLSGRSWITADFDGSGRVNIRDLYLLASHWQFGVPAASISSADLQAMLIQRGLPATVPEPAAAAAVLALLGVFGSSRARFSGRTR